MRDRLVLQHGWSIAVYDSEGDWTSPEHGLFLADTRILSRLSWDVEGRRPVVLSAQRCCPRTLLQLWRPHPDILGGATVRRTVRLTGDGLEEVLHIRAAEACSGEIRLDAAADFEDGMAVRAAMFGRNVERLRERPIPPVGGGHRLDIVGPDEITASVTLLADPPAPELRWPMRMAAGEERIISIRVLGSNDAAPQGPPSPPLDDWRARLAERPIEAAHRKAMDTALEDLHSLLLPVEDGAYPAAGAPWFATIFGRDALITGLLLVDLLPELARTILLHLARHQGGTHDRFREEEPGKILHEMRHGRLSRDGTLPFGRYYGAADSTPLFVMLADRFLASGHGAPGERKRIAEAAHRAAKWVEGHLGRHGLVCFDPHGAGLTVQSWKDSPQSMVHADGTQACAPIYPLEVQAYAVAAFRAAANIRRAEADEGEAFAFEMRADELEERLHETFWLDALDTFAMALDGETRPLAVRSSNPGHLLWTGVVRQTYAERLARTMLKEDMWSGWGLRTLSADEKAFDPLSYHNGAVWPHDTALFGLGLLRFGFRDEARMVADALVALADSWPGGSMPEVISGFDRALAPAPIPYLHHCCPQAWSAAGLIALLTALER